MGSCDAAGSLRIALVMGVGVIERALAASTYRLRNGEGACRRRDGGEVTTRTEKRADLV